MSFMGKSGVYGGHFEINCAAELYNRAIYIYNKVSKSLICGSSVQSFNPIYLWYDFSQEHYEVLVRVQGVSQPFVDDNEPAVTSQSSAPCEQNSVHGDFGPIISQPISCEAPNRGAMACGSVDSVLNRVSSLSGDGEALGPTGPGASSVPTQPLGVPNHAKTNDGLRASRHSNRDNGDILYCYVWAQYKARKSFGGYIKYMCDRWGQLRPDKPLSKSALATKGKRLHDRASKDLGGKGWLFLNDLHNIENRVRVEFSCEMSPNEDEVIPNVDPLDQSADLSLDPDENPCPVGEKPSCAEFLAFARRASETFESLKCIPVDQQPRRRIKKKTFSAKKTCWIDWVTYEIISSLSKNERIDIGCLNTAIYAVAIVFSFKEGEEFCVSGNDAAKASRGEPKWKVRLENKIMHLRREADIISAQLAGRVRKSSALKALEKVCKRYKVSGSKVELEKTLFSIKNQISSIASKIRRYQARNKAKYQNDLFFNDKKRLYRSIFEESVSVSEPPSSEEVREFWANEIWGQTCGFSADAEWLEEVKKNYRSIEEQRWVPISHNEVTSQLMKQMSWKAPGHDNLSNFWLKTALCCHGYLASAMNNFLEYPETLPDWVLKGKSTLLAKSRATSDPTQYRPITCLTTFWKALSGILGEKISAHLTQHSIIAEEQRGSVKNTYGTKTQLLINKCILEDAFRKRKNLSMVYIDYAKAFDTVPHQWILEVLRIYKVSEIIVNFLAFAMRKWVTDLYLYHESGVVRVDNVRICCGIFQGDSLSPLLFILAINPLSLLLNRRCQGYKVKDTHVTHILYMDDLKGFCDSYESLEKMVLLIEKFSSDIGMKLGLKKCKIINLKRGRYACVGGVVLRCGGVIEELGQGEVYKYLGVEELEGIKHEKMMTKIWQEAKSKLRKILETELNSKNMFLAINECVLPAISYSFGIINWPESELKDLDVRIRKLLNMYKMLEIKSDVDRLYVPRVSGGRGLQSVWDLYQTSVCRIDHVLAKSESELMKACSEIDKLSIFSIQKRSDKFCGKVELKIPANFESKTILSQAKIKVSSLRDAIAKKRSEVWLNKPQHGVFFRQMQENNIDLKLSLAWLRKCYLSPHDESYICAAQELALFTRYHEVYILKSHQNDKCRACNKEKETICHILSGCDSLAKREYFVRHNAVCQYIHYEILKGFSFACGPNWFLHKPRDVTLNKDVEVVYDQVITTDRPVVANRPDILVRDLKKKKVYIIDISCPYDANVCKKENEKISKYSALRVELQRLWSSECIVVPVIIGSLGVVSKNIEKHLLNIPGNPTVHMCQKIALLGSKRILKDVLARR